MNCILNYETLDFHDEDDETTDEEESTNEGESSDEENLTEDEEEENIDDDYQNQSSEIQRNFTLEELPRIVECDIQIIKLQQSSVGSEKSSTCIISKKSKNLCIMNST